MYKIVKKARAPAGVSKQELRDKLKCKRHKDVVTGARASLTRKRGNSAISAPGQLVQHTPSIYQNNVLCDKCM